MTTETDQKPAAKAQASKADSWPNPVHNRAELDARLKAGRDSGISPNKIPDVIARAKAQLVPRG